MERQNTASVEKVKSSGSHTNKNSIEMKRFSYVKMLSQMTVSKLHNAVVYKSLRPEVTLGSSL